MKLSQESELYGRYNGDSPYQAANKALSEIIRNRVKNNESVFDEINFYLVESTKGSLKKSHQYFGKRIELETPVIYKVGEQEIVKNFKNILKKVKKISDVKTSTKITKATKTPKIATEAASKKKLDPKTKKNVPKKATSAKKVATKKLETKE